MHLSDIREQFIKNGYLPNIPRKTKEEIVEILKMKAQASTAIIERGSILSLSVAGTSLKTDTIYLRRHYMGWIFTETYG